MKEISYKSDPFRNEVKEYLKNLKLQNKKIIDVGASMNDWSYPFIDAIVDINKFDTDKLFFQGNINHPEVWVEVEKYVDENGKFDFSVCSHTLEDISNPYLVCKKLEKISKSGIIMVPSKYKEMSRLEGPWRGYIHHRWIWNIEGTDLVGYPKVNFIDYDNSYDRLVQMQNSDNAQISLFWEDVVPIRLANDDFLGPSSFHVIEFYKNLININ
jgi:hypothetical protein